MIFLLNHKGLIRCQLLHEKKQLCYRNYKPQICWIAKLETVMVIDDATKW
jgi:hypothetical protein